MFTPSQHDVDSVGRKDLKRALDRRLRQGMRVDTKKQWPIDLLLSTISTDRLRDRQDVPLVEGMREGRATMPRGPKMTRCSATSGPGRSS